MKEKNLSFFKRLTVAAVLTCFTFGIMAQIAEARRGGRDPVQPGKNNCRLDKGDIKMPGYAVVDSLGNQVATKRVTVLWRYVDANCDGVMTWGVGPVEGADYLRIVPRTIYQFTSAMQVTPDLNGQVPISTHHFGPFDPVDGQKATAFREIHHDDFIAGLPAPGDFLVTMGPDGPPIPGLSVSVHLFGPGGDVVSVPGLATTWGAQYVLNVNPTLSNGTIPAGAYIFMDSQLNAFNIVPDASGFCENGFFEEDWINVNNGGAVQPGPNTADTINPNVMPIPILFTPACSNSN